MSPRQPRCLGLRLRVDVARVVADVNRAIARLNTEQPTARQHRRPLDPTAEAERMERAFGT